MEKETRYTFNEDFSKCIDYMEERASKIYNLLISKHINKKKRVHFELSFNSTYVLIQVPNLVRLAEYLLCYPILAYTPLAFRQHPFLNKV